MWTDCTNGIIPSKREEEEEKKHHITHAESLLIVGKAYTITIPGCAKVACNGCSGCWNPNTHISFSENDEGFEDLKNARPIPRHPYTNKHSVRIIHSVRGAMDLETLRSDEGFGDLK